MYPVVEVGAESGQGVGPPGAALPVGVDFLGGVVEPGGEVLEDLDEFDHFAHFEADDGLVTGSRPDGVVVVA